MPSLGELLRRRTAERLGELRVQFGRREDEGRKMKEGS